MKIFFSEYRNEYFSFTFGYCVYALMEQLSDLPAMFDAGFLPYSRGTIHKELFSLTRSLRINLSNFSDTSENRRIDRKAAEFGISVNAIPISAFDVNDPTFVKFCTEYAEERFTGGNMEAARLQTLLQRQTATHIIVFKNDVQIFGYVLACIHGGGLHYWFGFFDTAYLQSHSFGKWMMWRTIRWAKENGLQYVYLGTCYRKKAIYKIRDFKGAEFFDGTGWNTDMDLLKYLCEIDEKEGRTDKDFFKETDDRAHAPFKQFLT
jgi:arginine-tRNA-protein transferase